MDQGSQRPPDDRRSAVRLLLHPFRPGDLCGGPLRPGRPAGRSTAAAFEPSVLRGFRRGGRCPGLAPRGPRAPGAGTARGDSPNCTACGHINTNTDSPPGIASQLILAPRTCRKVSPERSRSDEKRQRAEELNKEDKGTEAGCQDSVESRTCLNGAGSRQGDGRLCTVSTALLLELYYVYLREAKRVPCRNVAHGMRALVSRGPVFHGLARFMPKAL